jgi:6-phosphogluconolactonase
MHDFDYEYLPIGSDEDFASEAAQILRKAIEEALRKKERCTLGLSGGSTPKPVYEELGKADLDWSKVCIFLVDDRYVPADHEDSNQRLVRETLLASANISEENIIFPNTTLPISECVGDYEERLQSIFGNGADIVTLGLGPDGHTASIFPEDEEALAEVQRLVLHTTTEDFAVRDRITVALPMLTQTHQLYFILRGEGKKEAFEREIAACSAGEKRPISTILESGKSTWIVQW